MSSEFIPVALKAALVNNPPSGPEGLLYREIGRSKPAPQGICVANSAGKVLSWTLMFDDDKSVLKFLDHALSRYKSHPDARTPVSAERFMRFPSRKLADVKDATGKLTIPPDHSKQRCPGKPGVRKGTLVGRIIGRALDKHGKPVKDTIRQEHYMEARFTVSPALQQEFADALLRAGEKSFAVPDGFARGLIQPAFLGQLDVDPLGSVPGSKNDSRSWKFTARKLEQTGTTQRVYLTGRSSVAGGQDRVGERTDGRRWEHKVQLAWEAYVDVDRKSRLVTRLVAIAHGREQLRWGNQRLKRNGQPDVRHLPAGHPIDLKCGVRYGLLAAPAKQDEVVAASSKIKSGPGRLGGIPAKINRLQAAVKRRQANGGDLSAVKKLMPKIGPLLQQRKFQQADALLDQALKLLEPESKDVRRKHPK